MGAWSMKERSARYSIEGLLEIKTPNPKWQMEIVAFRTHRFCIKKTHHKDAFLVKSHTNPCSADDPAMVVIYYTPFEHIFDITLMRSQWAW